MTTLTLDEGCGLLIPITTETVFDKPTIDEAGNWVRRLFVYTRDEQGQHDRPLLTQRHIETEGRK